MPTLLQSPPNSLSLDDVAGISSQLAHDLGRLVLKTEGFSIDDYLSLDGAYFLEYVDGCLQILPMPDSIHQAIALIVANLLIAFSKPDPDARTKIAPFPVRVEGSRFREPDVCFMLGKNAARRTRKYWNGADLVVEVISESNRNHDVQTKRLDYAAAAVPEYWIIDPEAQVLHVLTLRDGAYATHGDFGIGQIATSPLLPGLNVDISELFKQAAEQA